VQAPAHCCSLLAKSSGVRHGSLQDSCSEKDVSAVYAVVLSCFFHNTPLTKAQAAIC
jgi:hypothetical protein